MSIRYAKGRVIAGFWPRKPGLAPSSDHVGFVVSEVALGQVLLRVLRISPVNIFPPLPRVRLCDMRCTLKATVSNQRSSLTPSQQYKVLGGIKRVLSSRLLLSRYRLCHYSVGGARWHIGFYESF
jgi:hypothetical protein